MQFLDEMVPLAAVHITSHPMAVQRFKHPAEAGAQLTDLEVMEG